MLTFVYGCSPEESPCPWEGWGDWGCSTWGPEIAGSTCPPGPLRTWDHCSTASEREAEDTGNPHFHQLRGGEGGPMVGKSKKIEQ